MTDIFTGGRMAPLRAILLGSAACCAAAMPAAAQDESFPIDEIVVQAPDGWDANAGAADRAETIHIGPQDIERRNPQTLRQLFSGEAAVSVGGGIAAAQKVYVNGIEETNLAVTVDGSRQNQKIFHHATTNLIDPGLLKVVRIDPGVTAADSGPGALAGAIAYETVDAIDLLAPDQPFGGYATARYATNGNTFIGGLAAYGQRDGFEGLAYLRYGTGDDYENGDGDTIFGTAADFLSLLGKAAWQSDTGHRFELSAQQVTDDGDRPFRANIGNLTDRPNDPVVREYDLTSRNVVLSYEATQANGIWQPNALIAWSESITDVPEPWGSEGSAHGWNGKVENLFVLGELGTITAGLDFYSETADYTDPWTPKISEKADNYGLYAQARLTPLPALRLSFGLRGDYQEFEGIDGSTHDNSGLSGNIFAEYDINDMFSVNAGYSNVFGGFTLSEPYVFNPDWTYDDLETVRAENYNVGVAFATQGFTLSASAFRIKIDNARDFSWGGGSYLPFDFESEGYRLGAGYAWTSGFVTATYIDADVTSDGDAVDSDTLTYFGVPVGQVFALEVAQRIDRYGLVLGGTLEATSSNDDMTTLGYESIPGYTVVNLYAEYQPPQIERLTLRLEANNLFDETYADRATYGQEFDTVEPLYEPGRSIAFGARWVF